MFNVFKRKEKIKSVTYYSDILDKENGHKNVTNNTMKNTSSILHLSIINNPFKTKIEDFDITEIQSGREPSIICIDGFLTEGCKSPEKDWEQINKLYPYNAIYHIKWESERLRSLAIKATSSSFIFKRAALAGGVALFGAVVSGFTPLIATTLTPVLHSWSVACKKAELSGEFLAEIIQHTNKEYILIGHSLGSRVIHSCLSSLKMNNHSFIKDVHLLGGAVDNHKVRKKGKLSKTNWTGISNVVSGEINNYHSENDDILKYFYTAAEGLKFNFGEPIGRSEINISGIKNINASKKSGLNIGHMEYKENLGTILRC